MCVAHKQKNSPMTAWFVTFLLWGIFSFGGGGIRHKLSYRYVKCPMNYALHVASEMRVTVITSPYIDKWVNMYVGIY